MSSGQDRIDWMQFQRRKDFSELNGLMLDVLAEERGDVSLTAQKANDAFASMGEGLEGPQPPPLDDDDDEENAPLFCSEDAFELTQQVTVVLRNDNGPARVLSVMWSKESFDLIMSAWFHYITHDSEEASAVLDAFLDRFFDQAVRAIARDDDVDLD